MQTKWCLHWKRQEGVTLCVTYTVSGSRRDFLPTQTLSARLAVCTWQSGCEINIKAKLSMQIKMTRGEQLAKMAILHVVCLGFESPNSFIWSAEAEKADQLCLCFFFWFFVFRSHLLPKLRPHLSHLDLLRFKICLKKQSNRSSESELGFLKKTLNLD